MKSNSMQTAIIKPGENVWGGTDGHGWKMDVKEFGWG